jgi:aryl-alcohol dehydrogenase-like predicted oxidoreductase
MIFFERWVIPTAQKKSYLDADLDAATPWKSLSDVVVKKRHSKIYGEYCIMTSITSTTLGASGVSVAPLGIGTWAWGDNLYWGYGKDFGSEDLKSAFETAIAHNINFFDTAEVYGFGESERLLGQFMQQSAAPVQIATKYFPLPWRTKTSSVQNALDASLHRLQCDRVALYQVHWPFDFFLGQPKLMQALADAVQQGKIQSVGVSNYSAEQLKRAHDLLAKHQVPLAVNQVQYSLLARQIEHNGVQQAAKDLNVTVLAYSPLAQGLLTGKYTVENYKAPVGARRLDARFSQTGLEKLAPLVSKLQAIGEKYGRSPAQVSLNWLIAQGQTIPIPGAKNAEQVRQNAGALGWEMTAEERAMLNEV